MTKTEIKVRAASTATWLASLAGSAALLAFASDGIHALPDALETILYPSILTAITWLSGRAAKSQPDFLAPSTITAAETWISRRAQRRRGAETE